MNRILRAVSLAALIVLAGCDFADLGDISRFQEDFHFHFDVQPNCRLSLETQNGSVEVTAWDKNEVEIEGAKFANSKELLREIKIEAQGDPDLISVRTVVPIGHHFGGAGARYTLHVPRKMTIDRVNSSNAQVRLEGIEGNARLRTSNGSIHVTTTQGNLEAETSNASIEIQAHRGDVDANTSNGHIEIESEKGRVSAETSNSSIEARLKDPDIDGPIRLGSSNGSISLILDAAKLPDIKAVTSNSSITVRLPAGSSGRIEANTSNSSITSDFDLTVRGSTSKNHLEGTIGSGGPTIHLETSNGSIRIAKGL